MVSKPHPATRHVISINDLSDKEIETIFDVAQSYLDELPDRHFPYLENLRGPLCDHLRVEGLHDIFIGSHDIPHQLIH